MFSREIRQGHRSPIETPVKLKKWVANQRVLRGLRHPDPLGKHDKSDHQFPQIYRKERCSYEAVIRPRQFPLLSEKECACVDTVQSARFVSGQLLRQQIVRCERSHFVDEF
jgi:hypothetical protein